MTDHRKPHNGRDLDGRFRVRQVDVDELLEDPKGTDFVRDDVRLGGAVADTGPNAAAPGKQIAELIAENRENVDRLTKRTSGQAAKRKGARRPRG